MAKIYLAGTFRNMQHKQFLEQLQTRLKRKFIVYSPHLDVGILNIDTKLSPAEIVEKDLRLIDDCDIFLAVLDSTTYAPNTLIEMGVAFERGKKIIVYNTNVDKSRIPSIFLEYLATKIVFSEEELLGVLEDYANKVS